MEALQQKLESVSHRYLCGDLLFDDNHHLSTILAQRKNLNCTSPIEKAYFKNSERRLKLKSICFHCGAEAPLSYLLCMDQLREECMTGGFSCLPICRDCLGKGKKVETIGKKNMLEARKEKERRLT